MKGYGLYGGDGASTLNAFNTKCHRTVTCMLKDGQDSKFHINIAITTIKISEELKLLLYRFRN
jgi:hypothetical protein